jgi:hypothetical protein
MKRAATMAEINKTFEARRKALGRPMTLEEIDWLDRELRAVVERDEVPAGALMVGVSEDSREVIINHPDLEADANGVGHICFTPAQARNLARLLLAKADECVPQ